MGTRSEELAEVRRRLALYLAAESQLLTGAVQSYTIGSRTLTKVDAEFLRSTIEKLQEKERKLIRNGSIRIQRFVPRDF